MTKIEFRTHIADKINYILAAGYGKHLPMRPGSQDSVLAVYGQKSAKSRLDEALWTFSDSDFLPHAMIGDRQAFRSPVILTPDDRGEMPHYDILVNLSQTIPECYARFERPHRTGFHRPD